MGDMLSFIGDWGHALAAASYAVLALWVARHRAGTVEQRLMATGLFLTALWAFGIAAEGTAHPMLGLGEALRNLAWLTFMFVLLQRGQGEGGEAKSGAVTVIYGLLGLLLCLQAGVDILARSLESARMAGAAVHASVILRLFVGIGALLLAHNLYLVAAPEGRARLKLPLAALAAMWTYDLNLYTIAWLEDGDPAGQVQLLYAMRGFAMAALVPVLWLGAWRADDWTLRLSRAAAFQSLSLVAIGAYLVAMALLASILDLVGGPTARMFELGLIFTLSAVAIGLLPSRTFRAWLKVTVAKHFFQHRYDYRTEWMRFAATLGRPGPDGAPLHERVIKAVADITDSPAGLLLLRDEGGALALQAAWNWPKKAAPAQAMTADAAALLESSGWIHDIGAWRARPDGDKAPIAPPPWMVADRAAWALVPLIHFDRLTGAILLARPRFDRDPDWEDFDMLRAAGRQAASYISEAQGQAALSDAQRFEEFNRRFAFIMHDIKNLVSQLSLVARNAERHADNPEFRADMVLTLKDSVGKMNELLARLSQHHKGRADPPRPMLLQPVVDAVVRAKGPARPILVGGAVAAEALADPARVEQILLHLVQNAIDASPPDRPVTIGLGQRASGELIVEVIDAGTGMDADFIATELFKPFRSGKVGGFGIGAFEARTLAQAMGGRIEVQSRRGAGSRFTLVLPAAARPVTDSSPIEKAA